jgi:hypothetical protein
MPLQNRVTPFGEIIVTSARGLFMGNRGRLHDENRTLRRQFTSVWRWLVCKTTFKNRHRTPMTPGQYTELFFLDEATAFAAGHRPCAECRRADYLRFRALWQATHRRSAQRNRDRSVPDGAEQIDRKLQHERMNADGTKRCFRALCGGLPDGVFVTFGGTTDAFLIRKKQILRWTPRGYDLRQRLPARTVVDVLTPRSTVRVIAAGYAPIVHPSA